jgi:flagellar biosynthesis/type III secretory pathway protein FliH
MMSSSSRLRFRGAVDDGLPRAVGAWDLAELAGARAGGALELQLGGADQPLPEDPRVRERREAEEQLAEAYARGLDTGRAEGRVAEAQRLDDVVRALSGAVEEVRDRAPTWLQALDENLIALSTAVARAVVGRELKSQPEDIAALVQRAVTEFPLEARLRIRLNPADLSAISSPLSGDAVAPGRDVRWIPDPSIAPGGCFVEGPESLMDGRVEKALETIYNRLVYG